MPKILRAKVHWNAGWENSPGLELLVDRYPEPESYRFKKVSETERLYWGEDDGFVRFVLANSADRHGALSLNGRLENGEEVSVWGCWSSHSGYMNQHFPHTMEASLMVEETGFDRGYTFRAGFYPLIEKVKEEVWPILELDGGPAVRLVQVGTYYSLAPESGVCTRCKGFNVRAGNMPGDCMRCNGTGKDPEPHMHPCASCHGAWYCDCVDSSKARHCCGLCQYPRPELHMDHAVICRLIPTSASVEVSHKLSREQLL